MPADTGKNAVISQAGAATAVAPVPLTSAPSALSTDLVENAADLIFAYDSEGRLTYVNAAAERISGYARAEVLGRSVAELIAPEFRADVIATIRRKLAGEPIYGIYELELLCKDGRRVPVEISNSLIYRDGKVVGMQGIARDLAERRRLEDEGHLQGLYLEQLFAHAPEGIVLIDGALRVRRLNAEFTRIFGFTESDAIGHVLDDLIVPAAHKAEGRHLRDEAYSGRTISIESQRCRKDGSLVDVSILVTPIRMPNGESSYYAIYRDISARKQAERMQAALYRIADVTRSAADLPALYRALHGIVGELMDARNLYIALRIPGQDALTFPYAVDEKDTFPSPDTRVPFGRGLTEYVLRSGKPVLATPEMFSLLRDAGEVEEVGAPSVDWLGVPLKSGATTFGVLVVQSYSEAVRYGENEERILTFVSQQIASAIEHRRQQDAVRSSETKFRALAETTASIIYVHDRRRFLYVNAAMEHLTGYRRDELMAIEPWGLLHPDFKHLRGLQPGGQDQPMRREFKIIRRDGAERWVDIVGCMIDFEGRSALLGTGFDITERKLADENLQVQKAHLEQLFEFAPEAMAVLDPEQRIQRINRGFTHLFGYTPEEVVGRNIDDFILPPQHQGEGLAVTRSLTIEKQIAIETQRRHKDGHLIDVSILGTPVNTGNGQVAFYAIYRDVTRRKQAERQLHELNLVLEQRVEERTQQLQEVNKELEAFSYSVSHDLRAPLRHVSGFVQLLQKRDLSHLDETAHRYLRTIAESATRMGNLIDDLLAFSRTSRAELRLESVDLDQQISDVLRELAPALKDRRITWKVASLPRVRGDSALLRQVWMNLLGNAVKYTGPREHAHIEVGLVPSSRSEHPGYVTVFVRDNGVGFDMDYAQKLFGVFQRLHREEEFEGTGIGLATVRRIVTRHGGHVWAESKLDQGSTFYVALLPAREA